MQNSSLLSFRRTFLSDLKASALSFFRQASGKYERKASAAMRKMALFPCRKGKTASEQHQLVCKDITGSSPGGSIRYVVPLKKLSCAWTLKMHGYFPIPEIGRKFLMPSLHGLRRRFVENDADERLF